METFGIEVQIVFCITYSTQQRHFHKSLQAITLKLLLEFKGERNVHHHQLK
jgi:hypothetical protein